MYSESETIINVLRMFNNCEIYISDLRNLFGSVELGVIRNLYVDESIINVFKKDKCNELVTLTRKGKFILFTHENSAEIASFGTLLEENGFDTSYLGDYLKSNDLDKSKSEIFSIEDYEIFIHNLKKLEDSRNARRIMLRNNRNIG